jgi:hypothetical protein
MKSIKFYLEVHIVKKILLTTVTLSVLIFALSGCGVFSSPELGTIWNANGSATFNTAYAPFDPAVVTNYSLDIYLEFGGIWDSNKVKTGKVEFGSTSSEERLVTGDPEYTVIDGSYDPTTKLLQLRCEGKGSTSKESKITLRGRVTNKNEIATGDGFIYKTSDLNNSIGTFFVSKP